MYLIVTVSCVLTSPLVTGYNGGHSPSPGFPKCSGAIHSNCYVQSVNTGMRWNMFLQLHFNSISIETSVNFLTTEIKQSNNGGRNKNFLMKRTQGLHTVGTGQFQIFPLPSKQNLCYFIINVQFLRLENVRSKQLKMAPSFITPEESCCKFIFQGVLRMLLDLPTMDSSFLLPNSNWYNRFKKHEIVNSHLYFIHPQCKNSVK
jgi:hypothetical protein